MNLHGARILITGAAGGLGSKTTELLIRAGARVIGVDVRKPEGNWPGTRFVTADLTKREEAREAIDRAIEALGGLDILVNNAGTLSLQDAGIRPTLGSRHSMEVNFWALWNLTAEAMPHLLKTNGKVINIASLFAAVNAPLIPSYGASKRAVVAFSDSLRMQYHGRVTITTMYPGFINTAIHTDAVRQGLSVAKIIDIRPLGLKLVSLEEPVAAAAAGVVRACRRQYRDVGTTRMGTLTLWAARHLPSFVDAFIRTRIGYMIRKGTLKIELDNPVFP